MKNHNRNQLRKIRKKRVRVKGTAKVPRLSIFKSNNRIYLQLIDDSNSETLAAVLSAKAKANLTKTQATIQAATDLTKKAKAKKITRAVFDRSGYRFHGRIQAVKQSAEKNGLLFSWNQKLKKSQQ
ncbi:MAG: 50S ribosomal protein L18 [Candidatus Moranbacteria bacterium]|nr:50S ribosomal protein L18 [Candidatus Moranbacteria bacterium]